jgi:hypothetical protein
MLQVLVRLQEDELHALSLADIDEDCDWRPIGVFKLVDPDALEALIKVLDEHCRQTCLTLSMVLQRRSENSALL